LAYFVKQLKYESKKKVVADDINQSSASESYAFSLEMQHTAIRSNSRKDGGLSLKNEM